MIAAARNGWTTAPSSGSALPDAILIHDEEERAYQCGYPPSGVDPDLVSKPLVSEVEVPKMKELFRRAYAFSNVSGFLTEVDLCTSLPSRIPAFGWLLCLVTRHQLPGMQEFGCIMEGSSTDQDEGSNKTPGFLGILPDLLPCNNPSISRHTCTPRLMVYINEAWVDP